MLRRPFLTSVLFQDVEKDREFLRYHFAAFRELNQEGLDDVQFILVSQAVNAAFAHQVAAEQPFPIDVVHSHHVTVDGYPLWDVMESMRRVSPLILGEYVTFAHVEYFLCPDRLKKTLDTLHSSKPWLALGNLRRFGTNHQHRKGDRSVKELSDQVVRAVQAGQWKKVARLVETVDTGHWAYWRNSPKTTEKNWCEDVFFASMDWLRAIKFFDRGGDRMIFQDIYDVMKWTWEDLDAHKQAPPVLRLSPEVHRAMHFAHPKEWSQWNTKIRDFFLQHVDQFEGTRFCEKDLWARLIDAGRNQWATVQPVQDMRYGPAGTVTRYRVALADWLDNGGLAQLDQFYQTRGRERQTA